MNTIDLHEKSSDLNTDLIKCTASLVAAYVSRNAVGVGDLPVLIDQVHTAISVLQSGMPGSGAGWSGPTRGADRGLDPGGRPDQLHRRPVVQDPEAPPHGARPHPRALPGQVRPAGRLPDGRPRLRRQALADRQGDPARPQGRLSAPRPAGPAPTAQAICRRHGSAGRRPRPAMRSPDDGAAPATASASGSWGGRTGCAPARRRGSAHARATARAPSSMATKRMPARRSASTA